MPMRWLVAVAIVLGVGVGFLAVGAGPEGQPGTPPPMRQIPGVTAPDQFPRGCVDCHVNRPDMNMDVRLSTIIGGWQEAVPPEMLARLQPFAPEGMTLKGKHPKVTVAGAEIPKSCLMCHSKTSRSAPPFVRMLHGIHLLGGEQNHFLSMFQGECTHCHKLDRGTGAWSLGNGVEQ